MDKDEEHEAMGAMIHRGRVEQAYAKMQERVDEHNDLARRARQYQADVAKLREALEEIARKYDEPTTVLDIVESVLAETKGD